MALRTKVSLVVAGNFTFDIILILKLKSFFLLPTSHYFMTSFFRIYKTVEKEVTRSFNLLRRTVINRSGRVKVLLRYKNRAMLILINEPGN